MVKIGNYSIQEEDGFNYLGFYYHKWWKKWKRNQEEAVSQVKTAFYQKKKLFL